MHEFKEVDDKRVLWDLIKYRISQASIKFGRETKAKEISKKSSEIESSLKQCGTTVVFVRLQKMSKGGKPQKESIIEYERISKGAIIRSRAALYEKDEQSNKLNQE